MSTAQSKITDKQKGNNEFKLKNYHSAIQYYKMYISQEHNDNIQALLNIAMCHFKLQEYQTAIAYCDEALTRDQQYLKAYYRRAMCRKQIVDRQKENYVQKYKLALDCKIFCNLCNVSQFAKEKEELAALGRINIEQIKLSYPQKMTQLQSGILQIEKENIEASSLSWLKSNKRCGQRSAKFQINEAYRNIAEIERQKVVNIEKLEMERNKIKQLKGIINETKKREAGKQFQIEVSTTQVQQQKNEGEADIPKLGAEQISWNVLSQSLSTKQIESKQNQVPSVKKRQQQQNNVKQVPSAEVSKQIDQGSNMSKDKDIGQGIAKQEKKESNEANQVEGTVDEIFQKYFKEEISNSRDVFSCFGKNLVLVLNSIGDSDKKQGLLAKVAKEVPNFRLTYKGLSRQYKEKVKQCIRRNPIKEQTKKLYDI